nr:hypothetical protein [Tanacetum cinerariifolium]
MGFMVYEMDVKSAFLYGTIEEEVYVYQPLGFEVPDYPNKVYKVVKALYGLHQALRSWYETLASYLLGYGFQRGKIDQTLFIKKKKVKQKPNGIFISQDKYVAEILRKFGLIDEKSASTHIDTEKPLLNDPDDASKRFDQIIDFLNASAIKYALTCMSAKRTAWNEFSSSMASAIICLSTGRKFNCSKYIFDSLVRNVDSSSKLYMYPRFLQLMIRAQVGDLSTYTIKYSSTALTQKVFANMGRVGKEFFEVATSLFEGTLVPQQAATDVDDVVTNDVADDVPVAMLNPLYHHHHLLHHHHHKNYLPHHIRGENLEQDKIAQALEIIKLKQRGRLEESQAKVYHIDLEHADKVLSMQDDEPEPAELQEDDVIEQVQRKEKEDNVVLRYQALKKKPQTEAQASKNMMIYLKNMAGFKMDYFKGIIYDAIRPIFEKYFNSNVAFLEKSKEELEEEESRALKRKTRSFEKKAAKKQKLDEEVEELKKHL